MSIIVMLCFARSGGTVLNQCLASLHDVVMLSEVNPLGGGWGQQGQYSFTTVKNQACNWYGIDLESDDFTEGIISLKQQCDKTNRRLIIRDWSFVNFMPCENNNLAPPDKFLTLESLETKCEIMPFAFVRDAIDVWISYGMPVADDFFRHYLTYLEELLLKKIPIYKYEDFCVTPQVILEKICNYTNLKYQDVTRKYSSLSRVNGDIQNEMQSRGMKQKSIKPLARLVIPQHKILELTRCHAMKKCNKSMGYTPAYYHGTLKRAGWRLKIFLNRDGFVNVSS